MSARRIPPVDFQDKAKQYLALTKAVEHEDVERVQRILADAKLSGVPLANGADAVLRENVFRVIHKAAEVGNPEVMRALLDAGADVMSKGEDNATPLHVAALYDHTEVAKLLIKAAGRRKQELLDAQTEEHGETALHLAVKHMKHDMVLVLLKQGASCDIESREGYTPVTAANGVAINFASLAAQSRDIAVMVKQHVAITQPQPEQYAVRVTPNDRLVPQRREERANTSPSVER